MSDTCWSEFRSLMPVARHWSYLDHAAVAPLPAPTQQAIQQWSEEAMEQGDVRWPDWARAVERTRRAIALLLNADAEEIALVPSTTAGLGLVAEGLPWQPGENVVTLDNEFPSNLYPWLNLQSRGVEVRRVPTDQGAVDLTRLLEACDDATRLVTLSWVGYASGWRIDVAELVARVHARGPLVCLDAIQGLGVFPLDVRATEVDFVTADGHKWLLGPEGCGLFYVNRARLAQLRPLGVGWNSVKHRYDFQQTDFDLRDEAARYEGGSLNTVGALALGASLELLSRFGLSPQSSALADRVLSLTSLAASKLADHGACLPFRRDPQHATGILTFTLTGHDPAEVRRNCLADRVVLSCRGGGLRISLHAYNDESDIVRLLDSLPEPRSVKKDI